MQRHVTPLGLPVLLFLFGLAFLTTPPLRADIEGVPQGYGWCPICGRDMPLSHDFTHGRMGGGQVEPIDRGGDGGSGPVQTYQPAEPDPGITAYNEGIDLYNAGHYAQAEAYFRRSLDLLPPWDSDPWRMIGKCLQNRSQAAEAMDAYRRALRRNLFDSGARHELHRLESWQANTDGVDLARRGDWAAAAKLFRKAARLDSDNDTARDNLALAELLLKRQEVSLTIRRNVLVLAEEAADTRAVGTLAPLEASHFRPRAHTDRPLTYALDEQDRQRAARIRSLGDAELNQRIDRTEKLLKDMGDRMAGWPKLLQQYVAESQQAQREALKKSAEALKDALTAGLMDKLKKADPAFETQGQKIQEALADLQKDLAKAAWDYATSPRDREARLKAAQDVLQGAYSFLSKASQEITESGPDAVKLAAFLTDYSYEATRWNLARTEINRIVDNMDRPGGELDAQQAVIRLHQRLVQERNRRKAEPTWARPVLVEVTP